MADVKVMVVPGKIAVVPFSQGMTVLDACKLAEVQKPGIGWVDLAENREVRVQNRKFSNTEEVPEGYFGTVRATPLASDNVVLILTKISGNAIGEPVMTCKINGEEYALETPVEIEGLLQEVADIDLSQVDHILVNGLKTEINRLICDGDDVTVVMRTSVSQQKKDAKRKKK